MKKNQTAPVLKTFLSLIIGCVTQSLGRFPSATLESFWAACLRFYCKVSTRFSSGLWLVHFRMLILVFFSHPGRKRRVPLVTAIRPDLDRHTDHHTTTTVFGCKENVAGFMADVMGCRPSKKHDFCLICSQNISSKILLTIQIFPGSFWWLSCWKSSIGYNFCSVSVSPLNDQHWH